MTGTALLQLGPVGLAASVIGIGAIAARRDRRQATRRIEEARLAELAALGGPGYTLTVGPRAHPEWPAVAIRHATGTTTGRPRTLVVADELLGDGVTDHTALARVLADDAHAAALLAGEARNYDVDVRHHPAGAYVYRITTTGPA